MTAASLRFRSLSSGALLLACLATASGAHAAETPAGAPKKSPFMPPATAAGPVSSTSENVEFAGVSTIGQRTDLIFHDKSVKKNRWVGIGETVEGISVVSYDPRRDEAVVKVNGVQKTLALRKPSAPVNTPASAPVATFPAVVGVAAANAEPIQINPTMAAIPTPAPATPVNAVPAAPSGPAAPATPEQIAKQETDARMLVSDLLEIGMAQRRAYEEAQRRANQGGESKGGPAAAPQQPGQAPAPAPGGEE